MKNVNRFLMLVVIALGVYFRGDRILSRPIWMDERITRDIAHLNPWTPEFRLGIHGVVSAAPLDYVLTWAWGKMGLAIDSNLLRVPAFVYGLLLLALFWRTLRRAFPNQPTAHVVGMSFLSMHVVLTFYSQEARPYSLWALLSGLQAYAMVSLLDASLPMAPTGAVGMLTVANVLLLQTSSAAVFQIAILSAIALWVARGRGQWSYGTMARYIGLTIFLPCLIGFNWIYHSIGVEYPAIFWTGSLKGDMYHCLRVMYASVAGGFKWTNVSLWALTVLGLLWRGKEAVALVVGKRGDPRAAYSLIFLGSCVCLLLIALGDLHAHYLICQRQLVFVVPFGVLASSVLATHPDKRIRFSTVLVALFYVAYNAYRFSLGDRL